MATQSNLPRRDWKFDMPVPVKRFLHYATVFLGAVVVAGVVASVFSTQFVIAGLQSIDVDIPLATRLSMTVDDFGILSAMLPAVAACFLPGFLVAGLLWPRAPGGRTGWFVLAGGVALVTELLIMQASFDLMPIAGARSTSGLLMQGVAGALGGLVFARGTKNA